MGMDEKQLNHLDLIAYEIRSGKAGAAARIGPLSTGERLYVALAANDISLVPDYTIAQALARLGEDDVRALVQRHRYGG